MKLDFRGITLWRKGVDGVVLKYRGRTICIDYSNTYECNYTLNTRYQYNHVFPEISDRLNIEGLVEVIVVKSSVESSGCSIGYLLFFNNGFRVYHTGYSSSIENVLSIEKPIHLLLIPISGDEASPEEACEVVKSLKPVLTIPIGFKDKRFFYKFRDICQPYTQIVLLTCS